MNFYTSIFKNSKVGNVTRYGEAGSGKMGSVVVATFEIEGHGPQRRPDVQVHSGHFVRRALPDSGRSR